MLSECMVITVDDNFGGNANTLVMFPTQAGNQNGSLLVAYALGLCG